MSHYKTWKISLIFTYDTISFEPNIVYCRWFWYCFTAHENGKLKFHLNEQNQWQTIQPTTTITEKKTPPLNMNKSRFVGSSKTPSIWVSIKFKNLISRIRWKVENDAGTERRKGRRTKEKTHFFLFKFANKEKRFPSDSFRKSNCWLMAFDFSRKTAHFNFGANEIGLFYANMHSKS